MDQLPVEIQEKILHHFLWDEIEELYRLRVVSKAWKSVIDEFTSRLFQVWYRRCKIEIPNDHLTDIIQAKYPLVAQPWQKFYWVDSRLPHVAKNAYEIWKSFPNFDEGIDARIEPYGNWPRGLSISDGVTNMNDKYIGRIAKEYGDWVTEISPWNAEDDFSRKYHFKSDQIEFYTTEKGTFVVLVKYVMANHSWEYYISKHPIDRLDLPPELISLGQSDEQYYFTQNECFSTFRDGYPSFIHVEHRTLTERGFETSTIIKPPAEIVQHDDWWGCPRIEICGCTLYVMLKGDEQKSVSIAKYKISRNSKGKLSFTLEEFKVATRDEQGNSALYSQIYSLLELCMSNENLCLTDHAFAAAKFHPWLTSREIDDVIICPVAVHGNYVIGVERVSEKTQLYIFQKDNLIECMEANDPDHLKPPLKYYFPCRIDIEWIGIIYVGLKAKILVQYDNRNVIPLSFY